MANLKIHKNNQILFGKVLRGIVSPPPALQRRGVVLNGTLGRGVPVKP